MQKSTAVLIALVAALICLPAAAAEGVSARFSDKEISVIRAWYDEHAAREAGNSKGKSKGGKSLPPGIAKNLARGKALPPGIAKQVLAADLTGLLPPVKRGFERVEVNGKVLLVEIATQVIHDVLEDVILR